MRLVTRSDFDGLVCAALLVEVGVADSFLFVHPKDLQDGKVPVSKNDILANVPYVPGCGLWFDHHTSEISRLGPDVHFTGACYPSPSAAKVVWDYYGGDGRFNPRLRPILDAVNKSDSGQFTCAEILRPEGWNLVSFMMDPRTGLGRYKDYRISNLKLMEELIFHCRTKTAEEILELPDMQERVKRYFAQDKLFREMLRQYVVVSRNVIITDLRPCQQVHVGNRFLVFALHPDQNVEVRVLWGRDKENVVVTCGHSIINRTCRTNVGQLMAKYGGGGHLEVGTCQVSTPLALRTIRELIEQLRANG